MRLNCERRVSFAALGVLLFAIFSPATSSFAADAPANRAAARQSPDWLRDAVVYEVFPRAFSKEGNFKGVTAQLDRLKDLGVTVIWLMPIHPVGKLKAKGTLGSPYAVRDYDAINPEYGTGEDLKQLVTAAHQRGMKVFIDIVANHTSWDSVLLEKHPDWYTHDAGGKVIPPNPDWVDVADLDYSNKDLRKYMSGMLVRWLRDYGLDGFRCDYASGVPTDFWEAVRPELDKVRPGLAFLAESDDPALLDKAFDIDYAWDFYHAMSDALVGRAPASKVRETWQSAYAKYPRGALRLRFSDNHDQLRTTGAAGLPAALAASAVMFTLDGAPLLYNGMEVGDGTESAAPGLFERAPIAWEMEERRPQIAPYYRALAALRRAHPAFTRGTVHWLRNGDETRVLSYERAGAGESLVVAVNLSNQPFSGTVAAPAGEYVEITEAAGSAAVTSMQQDSKRTAKLPALLLGPWEFRVFRRATP
jgi:glycosidase